MDTWYKSVGTFDKPDRKYVVVGETNKMNVADDNGNLILDKFGKIEYVIMAFKEKTGLSYFKEIINK